MKFKVGDWIRSKDGIGISRVGIDTIKWYEEIEDKDIVNEWELWQPQPGEWCWQSKWDKRIICLEYNLVKFIVDMNTIDDEYEYRYEPFIGELPSFIKELK